LVPSIPSHSSFTEQGVKAEATTTPENHKKEEFLCFHALQKLLIQRVWAGEVKRIERVPCISEPCSSVAVIQRGTR